MSKHTPGPWFYVRGDEWSHSVCTKDGELPNGSPSFWAVASVNKRREPEHEANARLIAAAPDLLAFAQQYLADYQSEDGLSSPKHYARLAHEAITRATGEPT